MVAGVDGGGESVMRVGVVAVIAFAVVPWLLKTVVLQNRRIFI